MHNQRGRVSRVTARKGAQLVVHESRKRSQREEAFLVAALGLFAEQNFAAVTIKDIANSLGVNTALIYYYFESKTALLHAAIDFIVARTFENIKAVEKISSDPSRVISTWLENHVKKHAEIHRFVKIALDFKGAPQRDPAIEATIARFYTEERNLLSRAIRQGVERRMFNPVDADRMAQFISTYLDGCMVRSVIVNNFNLKGAIDELRRTVFDQLGCGTKSKSQAKRA